MATSRKRVDGTPQSISADTSARDVPTNRHDYGDRVAMRAYELYLARDGSDGRDFDDWLTTERKLARPRDDDRQG